MYGAGGYGCCLPFSARLSFSYLLDECVNRTIFLCQFGVCLSKFVRNLFSLPKSTFHTSSQITYTHKNKRNRGTLFRTVARLGKARQDKARQRGVKDGQRSNWSGEQAAEAKGCRSVQLVRMDGQDGLLRKG